MKRIFMLPAIAVFLFAAIAVPALAAADTSKSNDASKKDDECAAYIAGIVGKAEYRENDENEWQPAELNMCLYIGDRVRTQQESALALKFGPGIEVRVNALSVFTVKAVDDKGSNPNKLDMKKGEAWAKVAKKDNTVFQIGTPTAVAGVRGTEFSVTVDEEGEKSSVHVLEGTVSVFNDLGEVLAEAGFTTDVLKGKLPLDPAAFDIDSYKEALNSWKDQISIGAVKEKLMGKVNEIKGNVKEKMKTKIPRF
jgi:hypothetical protein